MAVKFNPFTGQLQIDEKGSGGASYIDGEVQNFSALPETVGSPAVDSAYLVREAEGTWLLNRKPAGIYIRTANTGTRASDWTYAGEFPDVFNDANFVLYDNGDSTRNLQFQLSGITTGTTRTIAVPDKNITLDDAGDSRTPSSHASSHAAAGSDPLAPSDIGAQSIFATETTNLTNGNVTLAAARAKIINTVNFNSSTRELDLPTSNNLVGDTFIIRRGSGIADVEIYRTSAGGGNIRSLAGTITSGFPSDRQYVFIWSGTNWATDSIAVHDHPASEVSGLGTAATADIGTAAGEVAAGDHGHGNINSSGLVGTTANLPLKTGTGGIVEAGAFGTGAGEFAEGNHTHTQLHDKSHTMTDATSHTAGNHKVFYSDGSGQIQELALGNSGEVLTSNGASAAPSFAAASGGGVTAVGASTADVLSVSGSDLIADDGGTIDDSDPFIKWDDTAGKLVYANPLSRPSGAFYVGLAPTTTALGTNSINIQGTRSNANQVASASDAIAIGNTTRADGSDSIAIGSALARSAGTFGVAVGYQCFAGTNDTIAIGTLAASRAINGVSLGRQVDENLRSIFATRPFNSVYWGGQTTNATPLILNLDATATNRFTIAANTALAVDILLVARRSDTADKWLVARRFLGIRRDGSNNTSLIGSVQTLGTDQTDGSPTWSFTLTADDTNEALQLEVTGAASETVQWRATAFYRVV